jgi:ATP-dependent Clp protease ATP-binding subunit ClpC
VYDRLTTSAREALVLAADEARTLGHQRIDTEHLLLGLLRLGDPATAALGLTLPAARRDVRSALGARSERTIGELRLTPEAKLALEHAGERAGDAGADPGHLLAVLREEGGGAAELLADQARADDADVLLALAARSETVTARALASLGVEERRLREAVEQVRRR